VIGQTQAAAAAALQAAGCPVTTTTATSTTVPIGEVIAQTPNPALSGTTVTIVVSIGDNVPNVLADSQAAAEAAVAAANLIPSISYQQSVEPLGTVVTQKPAPGRLVEPGSTVALTISGVVVPNEVGKYLDSAEPDLTNHKLLFTTSYSGIVGCGLVTGQSPQAGTVVSIGATVTLDAEYGCPT
jgi:serine/threonine-protein kinase